MFNKKFKQKKELIFIDNYKCYAKIIKMLFNASYINKDYTKESLNILGKNFSFFEKIKLGGIHYSPSVSQVKGIP